MSSESCDLASVHCRSTARIDRSPVVAEPRVASTLISVVRPISIFTTCKLLTLILLPSYPAYTLRFSTGTLPHRIIPGNSLPVPFPSGPGGKYSYPAFK